MGDLHGKVALVTGAAGKRGMGHAFAARLARNGADLVVVDKDPAPTPYLEEDFREKWRGLDSIVAEIEALGRQALAVAADVSDPGAVDRLVKQALDRFGRIDILVNNAGISTARGTRIVDMEKEIWDLHLAVNLTGAFLLCKAVAKDMIVRGEGGKIINIASIVGKMGVPGYGPYCCSKFGLIGLTQVLALELAPYRINVNAVCPGGIDTDLVREPVEALARQKAISTDSAKQEVLAPFIAGTPFGRMAKAEEVANVVAFLASGESSWITGQSINVDGGKLMVH